MKISLELDGETESRFIAKNILTLECTQMLYCDARRYLNG